MEQIIPGEIVYEPHPRGNGFLSGWGEAFRDALRSKELTWRLIVRNVTVRYRQSFLGWLWAFLPGITTTVLFVYLRNQQMLQIRNPEAMPYPVYVIFGFTLWQLFSGGIVSATQSLTGSSNLLSKLNFPRESLVLSSQGPVLFDFLLRLLLVAVMFLWFNAPIVWTVVFLPVILVPLMLLVLGLGFVLSAFNALIRDTGNALTTILGLFFFLVPVIYPPPKSWPVVLINDLNPVSAVMIAAHDITVAGMLSRPLGFFVACLISVTIFFSGWRIFRLAQPIIAERI